MYTSIYHGKQRILSASEMSKSKKANFWCSEYFMLYSICFPLFQFAQGNSCAQRFQMHIRQISRLGRWAQKISRNLNLKALQPSNALDPCLTSITHASEWDILNNQAQESNESHGISTDAIQWDVREQYSGWDAVGHGEQYSGWDGDR